MPVPTMNILNGGRHADNGLSIQEFMIIPRHALLRERVRIGSQVFHSLANLLSQKGYATGVGDEGGFAPELLNNERGLQLILEAIKLAGWVPGKQVFWDWISRLRNFTITDNIILLIKNRVGGRIK